MSPVDVVGEWWTEGATALAQWGICALGDRVPVV